MKNSLLFVLAFLPAAAFAELDVPQAPVVPAEASVYFSPNGRVQDVIISQIDGAKKSIEMSAYHFSNPKIAKALLSAARRGVDVQLTVDRKAWKKNDGLLLEIDGEGVKVMVDDKHATHHNKVIVIDGDTVLTGSYNFNLKAENKNAENMVVLKSEPLAAQYSENFKLHREHAVPLDATE